jgi:hypothetical protein
VERAEAETDMPVDVSIYSRNPLKSVTDYENEFDRQQLQKQTIQSNALALQTGQLGLQDRARASAESNALRAAMGSGLDIRTPEGQAKAMTIAPNAAGPVIKALTDAAHTGAQTGEITAKTDTEKLKRFMQGHEWAMQKLPTVTNPAEIVQWATEAHKHGAFGDSDQAFVAGLTKALSAAQTPEGFAEWKNNSIKSGMKIKDQLPTNLTVDTGGGQAFVSRDAVTGRVTPMGEIPKTPSPDAVLRSQTEQTVAGMRQDQRAPVAVLDSAGNAVYVPPSEAIGKTPAKMGNELSPADKQKREAAYPTMTKSVQTFDSTSDRLIKDLQDLKNHPGLGSITGIAAGRLPGITDQGRAAQAHQTKPQSNSRPSPVRAARENRTDRTTQYEPCSALGLLPE